MLIGQLSLPLMRKLMATQWNNILQLLGYSRELSTRDVNFLTVERSELGRKWPPSGFIVVHVISRAVGMQAVFKD